MTKENLQELWNYYSLLENDLDRTSRYVEPNGQEDTYSLEFAKLLVLACTEVESLFKMLCTSINGNEPGKISDYKEIILKRYPHFGKMEVYIPRLMKTIKPFENWNNSNINKGEDSPGENANHLIWWDAYNDTKHYRINNFSKATYKNACNAISALHLLILRLGRTEGIDVDDIQGNYIENPYCRARVLTVNIEAKEWPDPD